MALIRHLNRLIEPTSGEILFNNTNILNLTQKELIQFNKIRCLWFSKICFISS